MSLIQFPKVLIFDLDGTIVNTEVTAQAAISLYFERHGKPVTRDDLNAIVGRSWIDAVEYLLALYPLSRSGPDAEADILVDYRRSLAAEIEQIPGSADAIRKLAPHFRMGIVSGSRREDIDTVLRTLGLTDCFERWLGFEDYSAAKPSPAPYLEAMAEFKVTAEDVLVFEDSETGIRAALAAGLRVVTVGPDLRGHDRRPPTPWSIPDFRDVDLAWIQERYAKSRPS